MLDIYRKKFAELTANYVGDDLDIRLAQLMTEMETHYKLSALPEIFDLETPADIKKLYLAVSSARSI